ncbi:replicative DNA helicase [Alteribacillus persepolensis]|uniref:Replicative DNA helicase n=1 Tax=Alteribacillus persepolensis TaxID=568899 RepID=A0A1G8IH11_9BACI|nr:replicative DNA helicase [Alteribacillus persepolensis]SDI18299.1 replicative DNA helicase [Alteribacillus persepolensis]
MTRLENAEAEQAVLGAILLEPDLIQECTLQAKHVIHPKHKAILKAMKTAQQKDEPPDMVTVFSYLRDAASEVGGISYLSDLAGSVASVHSFQHHQRLVFEAYKLRQAREQALAFTENATEENMLELQEKLSQLSEVGQINEERTVRDWLSEIAMDMTMSEDESGAAGGYETGLSEFDYMTGGLQPEDLIIVAARPSMGKTAFALNLAGGHCKNGGSSHVFSLEMGAKSLLHRILSAEGSIDLTKWKQPFQMFDDDDYDKATSASGKVYDWNLSIYETKRMVSDIRATVKKKVNEYPDDNHLVVIDYLQLMSASRRYENRVLEIGEITRDLKMMARELKVPVVLLSQLSRGVESRQDKRPMMSDLRESGNIEQDADIVSFLYREDYYDAEAENQNITEIIIRKQRNGPTGTAEMAFIKEYQKFVNLDRRHEEVGI